MGVGVDMVVGGGMDVGGEDMGVGIGGGMGVGVGGDLSPYGSPASVGVEYHLPSPSAQSIWLNGAGEEDGLRV